MPGSGRDVVIRLYRDSLSTPWGFRLQGGTDLKQDLTVQKVAVGSPAFGELMAGDILLEIQNCDSTRMSHNKAQETIRNSGGSLLLRIHRAVSYVQSPPPPAVTPLHLTYHAYSRPHGPLQQGGFMLHRLQDTLTGVLLGRATDDVYNQNNNSYSQTYPRGSSQRLAHNNLSSQGYNMASNYSSKTGHLSKQPWRPPSSSSRVVHPALPSGLAEPGWMPNALKASHARQRPSTGRQKQQPSHASRPQELSVAERPAWEGSLRSIDVPLVSERQPQISSRIAHYTPSTESAPGSLSPVLPDGYHAANLQYNSPMGMYSKEAVNEVLTGQLGTTTTLTRDSDVYRMVHNNDLKSSNRVGRGGMLTPGHPADNYARQSPSMVALEAQYVHPDQSFYSDF